MEIFIEKEEKTVSRDFEGNGKSLLKMLKINSESVIIVKNNEVITEDELLSNEDKIRILSVISGG